MFDTQLHIPDRRYDTQPAAALPAAEIEISSETILLLEIVARRVGADFGMEVRLGQPGEGSFFNPNECLIILDPLHVKEDPVGAVFVAFHEGMHRRLTPGVAALGLTRPAAEQLFSQLGFGLLNNCIEDAAVNDFGLRVFPGMREHVRQVYDRQFKEENAKLGTPEVFKLVELLGYWPKFAAYASEILREWHQGRFSYALDEDVKSALDQTISRIRAARTSLPESIFPSHIEIVDAAKKRLEIAKALYPQVEHLIGLDKEAETLRQMASHAYRQHQKLAQLQREIDEAYRDGDRAKAERLSKELKERQQKFDPLAQLPAKARQELLEAIKRALERQASQALEHLDSLERQLAEAAKNYETLLEKIVELKRQLDGTGTAGRAKLKEQLEEAQKELFENDKRQEDLRQQIEDFKQQLAEQLSGGGIPLPMDQLSEKTKEALRKLYDSLSEKNKEEFRRRAERQLEKVEDALNEDLKGKLNEDTPESHAERHRRNDSLNSTERGADFHDSGAAELSRRRLKGGHVADYDIIFRQISSQLEHLYHLLQDLFLRERNLRWEPGYSSGHKINLGRLMQSEADPNMRLRVWERRTIPEEKDFAVEMLVDVSLSMDDDGKKWETFKAAVLLAELFQRLQTPLEVLAFAGSCHHVKGFEENIQDLQIRKRFAALVRTLPDTNDARAVTIGCRHLKAQAAKYKIMLVLSDAGSNYRSQLRNVLSQIRKEGEVVVVHFGVGPETQDRYGLYHHSFGDLKVHLSNEERCAGERDFCEIVGNVVRDIVEEPERFL